MNKKKCVKNGKAAFAKCTGKLPSLCSVQIHCSLLIPIYTD